MAINSYNTFVVNKQFPNLLFIKLFLGPNIKGISHQFWSTAQVICSLLGTIASKINVTPKGVRLSEKLQ